MKTFLSAAVGAAALLLCASAQAATYSNTANIAVVDNGRTTSTITVGGATGVITGMSLTLNGLSHTYPDDLVIGLANLSAGLGFVFMSGAGGSIDVSNATLTFSDAASALLPATGSISRIVSGAYLPSNHSAYGFLDLANADAFADFAGLSANGDWTLIVNDVSLVDGGDIANGWSLSFTTAGVPEPATWALMIGGFGLVGGVLRRRKPALATA